MNQPADIITPEELAARLKLKRRTVYNHLGTLDEKCGVFRIGSRLTRIDWNIFYPRLLAGAIPSWRMK